MAETWDEEQLVADGFERMYIELEWYDGPRVDLADVDGTLHYVDGYGGAAAGRPASVSGEAGVDARYDELDALLAPYRRVPGDARRLPGELRYTGTGHRVVGTGYWFRWRPGSERGRDGTAAA